MKRTCLAVTGLAAALTLITSQLVLSQTDSSEAGQRLATVNRDPYPSTYAPRPHTMTVLVGATVLDGAGGMVENGTVVMADGKVFALGTDVAIPAAAEVIDA